VSTQQQFPLQGSTSWLQHLALNLSENELEEGMQCIPFTCIPNACCRSLSGGERSHRMRLASNPESPKAFWLKPEMQPHCLKEAAKRCRPNIPRVGSRIPVSTSQNGRRRSLPLSKPRRAQHESSWIPRGVLPSAWRRRPRSTDGPPIEPAVRTRALSSWPEIAPLAAWFFPRILARPGPHVERPRHPSCIHRQRHELFWPPANEWLWFSAARFTTFPVVGNEQQALNNTRPNDRLPHV
jgi:hypothetical protein